MDINELLDNWEADCQIKLSEPGRESIRIPSLHAKYLRILSQSKLKLKQVKNEFAEERKIRWNYYCGNYNTDKDKLLELGLEPFKFILKTDMSVYLDSDKELIKLGNKVAYYDEMVNACNQILLSLKNRTWELKTHVDWMKFEQGA